MSNSKISNTNPIIINMLSYLYLTEMFLRKEFYQKTLTFKAYFQMNCKSSEVLFCINKLNM